MMFFERIPLTLNPEQSGRLPAVLPERTVFISNSIQKGIDERLLAQLLAVRYQNVQFYHVSDNKKARQKANLKALIEFLNQNLPRRSVAFSLDFESRGVAKIINQEQITTIFRLLKSAKVNVILLYVESDETWYENFFTQLRWKTQLKNFLLGKYKAPAFPEIRVKISPMITWDTLESFEKTHQYRRFLQSRLFAMSSQQDKGWPDFFRKWRLGNTNAEQEEIIEAISPNLLALEICALRENRMLLTQGEFEVFAAAAGEMPNLLRELGRLRELTFRTVGEGTGLAFDLDEFDLYYCQLIIWDKKEERLVGGYRIGCGDSILRQHGIHGFYCSTLFRIGKGFYSILPKSLELGRSFIVADYQRKPQPLFLLWRGILQYLILNPQYCFLFGPVSISRQFSDVSRAIMVAFLKKHYFDTTRSRYLKPRKPFKVKTYKVDTKLLVETFGGELSKLDKFIEMNEAQSVRLPVLLKQYIRQNARFVAFNLDPKFSDCLDGFMLLDLREMPDDTLVNLLKKRQ